MLFRRVAEVAMCGRNIRYFLRLKKKDDRYFLCIYTNDDLTPFAKKIELLGNDCLCMSLRYEQVPLYLSIY